MPSQPDLERARQLAPHLFPEDPKEENPKLKMTIDYLVQRIAKLEKKSEEQILLEVREALSAEKNVPQDVQQKTSGTSPKRANAKFFANRNKDKFYPIEMRDKGAFKNMKEENVIYFGSENDALEANYKAAA